VSALVPDGFPDSNTTERSFAEGFPEFFSMEQPLWRRYFSMSKMRDLQEKPELVFEELIPGKPFRPLVYPLTEEKIHQYMETVGDRHPLYVDLQEAKRRGLDSCLAPPGLAAVYARLSYLQDHCMPSGGILLRQEFQFHSPARVGEVLEVRAKVEEAFVDGRGRKRVTFLIEAHRRGGEPVSTIRLYAIWPK